MGAMELEPVIAQAIRSLEKNGEKVNVLDESSFMLEGELCDAGELVDYANELRRFDGEPPLEIKKRELPCIMTPAEQLDRIMTRTAERFGVRREVLIQRSLRLDSPEGQARFTAIYLSRRLTAMSNAQLADVYGLSGHGAISAATNHAADRVRTDNRFSAIVAELGVRLFYEIRLPPEAPKYGRAVLALIAALRRDPGSAMERIARTFGNGR